MAPVCSACQIFSNIKCDTQFCFKKLFICDDQRRLAIVFVYQFVSDWYFIACLLLFMHHHKNMFGKYWKYHYNLDNNFKEISSSQVLCYRLKLPFYSRKSSSLKKVYYASYTSLPVIQWLLRRCIK